MDGTLMQLEPFRVRYRRALDDEQLRRNLLVFQRRWRAARAATLEGVDFPAAQSHLRDVKARVIDKSAEYLAQFVAAAEANGATVTFAAGPEDAIRAIVSLAEARGAGQIVKSKSMLSEEIDLNHGLEAVGLTVVETDLGEWLVQLAGERPSHMTAPAIHMNRFQTAALLQAFADESLGGDDIAQQVLVARAALRERFLAGEIGISGANILVAETGSAVLVTNEGNAELVTSIPPIHVVLAGVEKVVSTFEDAAEVLDLLAPSSTAQRATSYVSWITGPSAPNGELHFVLVDNGRSAMRESALFADALRCIRCGACSNICPSYGVVGGHVFGYIYSGAIGLVNTPFHHGIEHADGPQSLCVQCNACQTVCPVDIPLPRQILEVRAWAAREEGGNRIERAALSLWARPRMFRGAARVGSVVQRPFTRDEFVEPPFLGRLTSWRKLPAIARRPFRDRWPVACERLPGSLGTLLDGITVAYFVQCLTDWVYPAMGEAISEVLQSLGAEVVFPRGQHCCGLPAADGGYPNRARAMAKSTIRTLEASAADYIVTGGTSCAVAVLHHYPDLFADEPEWQMRARSIAGRFMDLTTFLTTVARLPAGALTVEDGEEAAYHYFCQSYNVLGFRDEPDFLLGRVCGLGMQPLPEATVCCGFGGSTSFTRPDISKGILERKLESVQTAGVGLLVTDNPGCIMHLRGGLAAAGSSIQVKHTGEVLADRIRRLKATTHS